MTDGPPAPSNGAPGDSVSASEQRTGVAWRAFLWGMRYVPQGLASRLVGMAARVPLPHPLRRPLLGGFARLVGMRMDEASRPAGDFRSFDALFTRKLRPGVRNWEPGSGVLASPVDGVIGAVGIVEGGSLVQAKGRRYTVSELLADESEVRHFEGGLFVTIYLSPRHYHRIHTPIPGRVVTARHIPGRLFPVHPAAVREVAHLFARNERLACVVDADVGPVAVVAVGAMNVGRISVAFDPEWAGGPDEGVTNRGGGRIVERAYADPPAVGCGDELMAFHLGSTVVLLTPPGLVMEPGTVPGVEVEVGRTLARTPAPD